ncbi:hypothetical protein [Halanaerobium hydrogeniformans]|uniref:Lipoprotein n=1 Tax=Halanaerobium hydrogeniformans TaxID=656519 RepID=E4RNA7_HALHG|nr:hypothetical protein [Halanaerobium hydrogeniformans]ADQ13575.1 hypothetical protein Halsa_0080 [Halanaerobium hydrogeniformans]
MNKKLNLSIICLIFILILTGCANEESNNDVNLSDEESNNDVNLSDIENPYGESPITLRNIITEKTEYLGEKVVVGPVVVQYHNVERGSYTVYPILGFYKNLGTPQSDRDVSIEVFYDNVENKSKWINLKTSDDPIIFLEGQINFYSNNNKPYIYAIDIKQYDYNNHKNRDDKISDIENPYGESSITLRNIIAEKIEYLGEEVVVEPVVVQFHNIERGSYTVYPILGFYENLGTPQSDRDVSIEVFYDNVENKSKWINLKTSDDPIILVKGVVLYYSNNNKPYIYAIDIKQYDY